MKLIKQYVAYATMAACAVVGAALLLPAIGKAASGPNPAFGGPNPGDAGPDDWHHQGMAHRWEAMAKELGTTPEQNKRIERIMDNMRMQSMAVRNDQSLTPQQQSQKMEDIRGGTRMKMRSVLTPGQVRKLDAMMAEHMQNGPRGPQ